MSVKPLRFLLAAGAIALIPAAAATQAASEADTYQQLDQLMNVFEKVRSESVDKVDDKTLIQGAINGMLASLDPPSSFLDAPDFTNLRTQPDGAHGGPGLTVPMEDGAVKTVRATEGHTTHPATTP